MLGWICRHRNLLQLCIRQDDITGMTSDICKMALVLANFGDIEGMGVFVMMGVKNGTGFVNILMEIVSDKILKMHTVAGECGKLRYCASKVSMSCASPCRGIIRRYLHLHARTALQ